MSQDTIEQTIRDCGYHCRGEVVPTHLCAVVGVPMHPDHDGARTPVPRPAVTASETPSKRFRRPSGGHQHQRS